ncbi:MAG: radical SAM protein [Nitrospinota bacterium]|nr:radical SAM protein [Nitrospinota bacterium]
MKTSSQPQPGAMTGRMLEGISSWHVAFTQDCNLRCRYCVTGHGAMGDPPAAMTPQVWRDFVSLAIDDAQPGSKKGFSFGCGETFLHFGRFIDAVDHLYERAHKAQVQVTCEVTTNGVLLDEKKMEALAKRRVFLTFSIDGPAKINDANRVNIAGDGAFAAAMANWEKYRQITATLPDPPSVSVQSVISDSSDLYEVARFWREREQKVFLDLVAEPPFASGLEEMERWEARRIRYLESFEKLAMEQARKLSVPFFLSEYRGPKSLFDIWTTLFFERSHGSCGAGISVMAIDVRGRLLPCEKFIGSDNWIMGDTSGVLNRKRLFDFRLVADALASSCAGCHAGPACQGGCLAATPGMGLSLNHANGCDFAKKVEGIARRSFDILCAE